MEILGVNIGETSEGVNLKDGGVTSITDGIITMSIPEDRISRKKHKGGFSESLDYLLLRRELSVNDVDRIYISTLGEEVDKNVFELPDIKRLIGKHPSILKCIRPTGSHHLNHAYSVFPFSNFENALIVVADMEGSIIGRRKYYKHWENSLERLSYFLAEKNEKGIFIHLLEREFDEEDVVGPGEMYGIFTQFCGFRSYTESGKTMGLAPYGDNRFNGMRLYGRNKATGKPFSYLKNNYYNSAEEIERFLKSNGFYDIFPVQSNLELSNESAALARLVQRETERIIIEGINRIKNKFKITTRNICIAGGVALNCTLNSKLLTNNVAENVFLQPACGDTGQSLGAATYGYYQEEFSRNKRHLILDNIFLTAEYQEQEIISAFQRNDLQYQKVSDIAYLVANLISKGAIIGWFQGRGELGPRALGARSIIADARLPQMKNMLNKVKRREPFRPFAPVCNEERAAEFFEINGPTPYMLFAPKVRMPFRGVFPSITHVDGTARLQTVSKIKQPLFHKLLSEFEKISTYPLMINTSLNMAGDPLVESPDDAVECFLKMGLDYLVINDFITWK